MKFLYRYYYTFFQLHLRDREIGRNKNLPWFSALIQVTAGLLFLFLGTYWGLLWLIESKPITGGLQKYHIYLLVALLFWALHYLLFQHFGVNKQTGLTDQYTFEGTAQTKLFFWIIWVGSFLFVVILGFLRHQ
ncbi:hypothetical protein [Larkinella rosea]|uniref:Uncharacterized protein n=1 Tax=Larkinella rosea TaxID=2025312 RepID=A0A3P1C3I3_9BACT|nr:hypothetical protein [Larkinella rosea]RRB07829.1 hypothetical protein EHT25_08655 [Larkinella rosea]